MEATQKTAQLGKPASVSDALSAPGVSDFVSNSPTQQEGSSKAEGRLRERGTLVPFN